MSENMAIQHFNYDDKDNNKLVYFCKTVKASEKLKKRKEREAIQAVPDEGKIIGKLRLIRPPRYQGIVCSSLTITIN